MTLCKHVNTHHIGIDGNPLAITCDLDLGHGGDHSAKYSKLIKTGEKQEDREYFEYHGEWYEVVRDIAAWNDAAGA